MVKTSSKKKRGLKGSFSKRVTRLGKTEGELGDSIISKVLQKAGTLAKGQWNLLLGTCTKWNLIPLEFDSVTGRPGPSALWKRCIHYFLVFVCAVIMTYRVRVTIERVAGGNLDIFTYICACHVVISILPVIAVFGSTYLSLPLCDVFKSWKSMEQISHLNNWKSTTMFHDRTTSMKILLLAIAVHLAATNASMLSLMGDVPTCVLPTLTRMGWLQLPDYVPRVIWSSAFLPLELLLLWSSIIPVAVVCNAIIGGFGTFKVFADQARQERVNNMNDWKRVYRLRRIMQVYNVILVDWSSTIVVMAVVGAVCAVILLLYVTIRPSNLPWFIYIWFPVVATLLMVILAWVSYDAVIVTSTVADVDGNLHSGLDSWRFRALQARRRTVYSRMLKSLRAASLKLGPFGEITLDVPVNAWDEIMNQLLFLLEL